MNLDQKKVLIIGGSSGMGLGIAKESATAGAELHIASRSAKKLAAAAEQIPGDVQTHTVDLTDETSIAALMAEIGALDHLVITGGYVATGPFLEFPEDGARKLHEVLFWGKYHAAKYAAPIIREGGSITFISGIYSHKATADAVALASSLGAVEALGRALAIALAPTRVNNITPGMVDTPQVLPGAPKEDHDAFLASIASYLPTKTVGTPQDIAQLALVLMTNPFMTGSTVLIDGGYSLV